MEQHSLVSAPADALLTAAQVAAWLQVSTRSVYDLAKRRGLPHLRVGPFLRFRRDELERFLAQNRDTYGGATH